MFFGAELRRQAGFLMAIPLSFAVVYLAMFSLEQRAGPLPKPQERRHAEEFILRTLDGGEWMLSAERGKVVVLNFWGTSCPPCVKETPALVNTANRFRDGGLRTIGICVASDEDTVETIRYAVERLRIPYPVALYRPTSEPGQLALRPPVAIDSVPVTVLIDRAGRVARTYYGAVTELLLRPDIERLLHE